jgi:hypothetical protein
LISSLLDPLSASTFSFSIYSFYCGFVVFLSNIFLVRVFMSDKVFRVDLTLDQEHKSMTVWPRFFSLEDPESRSSHYDALLACFCSVSSLVDASIIVDSGSQSSLDILFGFSATRVKLINNVATNAVRKWTKKASQDLLVDLAISRNEAIKKLSEKLHNPPQDICSLATSALGDSSVDVKALLRFVLADSPMQQNLFSAHVVQPSSPHVSDMNSEQLSLLIDEQLEVSVASEPIFLAIMFDFPLPETIHLPPFITKSEHDYVLASLSANPMLKSNRRLTLPFRWLLIQLPLLSLDRVSVLSR